MSYDEHRNLCSGAWEDEEIYSFRIDRFKKSEGKICNCNEADLKDILFAYLKKNFLETQIQTYRHLCIILI